MRKVVWLLVVLALVWGGWWFTAATLTQRAISGWFDAQQAAGDSAHYDSMTVQGFPLTIHTTLNAPAVIAADSGAGVEADRIDLQYAAYWPGHVAIELPDTPIAFVTRLWRNTLTTQNARLGLRIRPGTRLTLEAVTAQSGEWMLRVAGAPVLSADGLVAGFRQDPDDAARYRFRVNVASLVPGPLIRTALRLPDTWAQGLDALSADVEIGFDAGLDRHILQAGPPQPRQISLRLVEAAWGGLRLAVNGVLDIADTGALNGDLTVTADNWRGILALAQTAGLIDADAVSRIAQTLDPLATANGETRNLDVVVSFRDGVVSAGPFDLGRVPPLLLR